MNQAFRRTLKILMWIGISLLALLLLAWSLLYYYVYVNKKPLIEKITKEASEAIQGEVLIGDLTVVFWKDFPEVNLSLEDVELRDSLYEVHKRALLSAKNIYIKANFPSLFSEISQVEKVVVEQAKFHLFTDSSGYSNNYILQGKKDVTKEVVEKKKREIYFLFARLQDFHLLIEDEMRAKRFDVQLHDFQATIVNNDTSVSISAPIDAMIGMLGFNLDKGPFLENKSLQSTLQILYRKPSQQLLLPLQELVVDEEELQLGLAFDFGQKPATFSVEIADSSIDYRKGLSFLNDHIRSRLKILDLDAPVMVHARLDGALKPKDKPWVRVDFATVNNNLHTDYGTLSEASFVGYYTNKHIPDMGNVDSNSVISISQLKGKYNEGIPLEADSILVSNLRKGQTHLRAHIFSDFDVQHLNGLVDKSMEFRSGKASFDLYFEGHIDAAKHSNRKLDGFIKVQGASMAYKPKNFNFNKADLDFEFKDKDVFIRKMSLYKGNSSLHITGSAQNVLNAYFTSPDKMLVKATVRSAKIDLNDFKSLVASSPKDISPQTAERRRRTKMQTFNDRVERLLNEGTMKLLLEIQSVHMDAFSAENITANMDMLTNKILLNDLRLEHAGGHIQLNGVVAQNQPNNPFEIVGKINQVNLDEFLFAFGNFGMTAVTGENVKGKFSSDIDIKGNFTDAGDLLKRSIKGNVNFVLGEAAFINFFPFTEIKKYGLKNRGLDSIVFWDIKNNLFIEDGKVIIFPMEIRNNALNIFVKGIYAFDRGTDLSIEIPLANPKKDNARVAEGRKSKRKGLKVYLRAQDAGDGSVRISWDPLKRGEDAVDAKLHLTEDGEIRADAWDDPSVILDELKANEEAQDADGAGDLPEKKKGLFRRVVDFFRRGIEDDGKVRD